MSLDAILKALFELIRDEAKNNSAFRDRLEEVLHNGDANHGREKVQSQSDKTFARADLALPNSPSRKRGNRRAPALVDPIAEGEKGEQHLREALQPLDMEQLRDVVADFRMDPNKLVMKWKDRERVIDHIVITALTRRQKGDAFRT